MKSIEVGSKVFVYVPAVVRLYEIVAFRLVEFSDGLRCEVEAKYQLRDGSEAINKFFLDTFIEGMNTARDMKISDIQM